MVFLLSTYNTCVVTFPEYDEAGSGKNVCNSGLVPLQFLFSFVMRWHETCEWDVSYKSS